MSGTRSSAGNDRWADRFIRDLSQDDRQRSSGYPAASDESRRDRDETLGRLALERGLISSEALEKCTKEVSEERARGKTLPLGEVLVRNGFLSMESLIGLLREERRAAEGIPAIPRYDIQARLGEGATSVVYRARDREVRRHVALKVLRQSAALSDIARERFRREAQAAGALSHPNVVTVYDLGEAGGLFYIALELVEGKHLGEVMRAKGSREEQLRLLLEASRGVAAAHARGIVHRDIKPQNILISSAGEAKVGDFGLAHLSTATVELTRAGSTLGTPLYMAPEQVEGEVKKISLRTDVYALGAILYEILTGRPPHLGETVVEIYGKILREDPAPPRGPGVALDLATVAMKALGKEPSQRYASAQEFALDLGSAMAGEPIRARPEGTLRRVWRRAKRHYRVAAALALAAAVGMGVFFAIRAGPRHQAAADAIHRAREGKGTTDQQVIAWQEALSLSEGTAFESEAKRELDLMVARRKESVDSELATLNQIVSALKAREEYGSALEAIETAKARARGTEWDMRVRQQLRALHELVGKELTKAKDLCLAARKEGREEDVAAVRARVSKWRWQNVPRSPSALEELDAALKSVPPITPPKGDQ